MTSGLIDDILRQRRGQISSFDKPRDEKGNELEGYEEAARGGDLTEKGLQRLEKLREKHRDRK